MNLKGQKWRKPNSRGSESIREMLGARRVRQYELADALGISPATLSVMLRKGVKQDDEAEMKQTIENISSARGNIE